MATPSKAKMKTNTTKVKQISDALEKLGVKDDMMVDPNQPNTQRYLSAMLADLITASVIHIGLTYDGPSAKKTQKGDKWYTDRSVQSTRIEHARLWVAKSLREQPASRHMLRALGHGRGGIYLEDNGAELCLVVHELVVGSNYWYRKFSDWGNKKPILTDNTAHLTRNDDTYPFFNGFRYSIDGWTDSSATPSTSSLLDLYTPRSKPSDDQDFEDTSSEDADTATLTPSRPPRTPIHDSSREASSRRGRSTSHTTAGTKRTASEAANSRGSGRGGEKIKRTKVEGRVVIMLVGVECMTTDIQVDLDDRADINRLGQVVIASSSMGKVSIDFKNRVIRTSGKATVRTLPKDDLEFQSFDHLNSKVKNVTLENLSQCQPNIYLDKNKGIEETQYFLFTSAHANATKQERFCHDKTTKQLFAIYMQTRQLLATAAPEVEPEPGVLETIETDGEEMQDVQANSPDNLDVDHGGDVRMQDADPPRENTHPAQPIKQPDMRPTQEGNRAGSIAAVASRGSINLPVRTPRSTAAPEDRAAITPEPFQTANPKTVENNPPPTIATEEDRAAVTPQSLQTANSKTVENITPPTTTPQGDPPASTPQSPAPTANPNTGQKQRASSHHDDDVIILISDDDDDNASLSEDDEAHVKTEPHTAQKEQREVEVDEDEDNTEQDDGEQIDAGDENIERLGRDRIGEEGFSQLRALIGDDIENSERRVKLPGFKKSGRPMVCQVFAGMIALKMETTNSFVDEDNLRIRLGTILGHTMGSGKTAISLVMFILSKALRANREDIETDRKSESGPKRHLPDDADDDAKCPSAGTQPYLGELRCLCEKKHPLREHRVGTGATVVVTRGGLVNQFFLEATTKFLDQTAYQKAFGDELVVKMAYDSPAQHLFKPQDFVDAIDDQTFQKNKKSWARELIQTSKVRSFQADVHNDLIIITSPYCLEVRLLSKILVGENRVWKAAEFGIKDGYYPDRKLWLSLMRIDRIFLDECHHTDYTDTVVGNLARLLESQRNSGHRQAVINPMSGTPAMQTSFDAWKVAAVSLHSVHARDHWKKPDADGEHSGLAKLIHLRLVQPMAIKNCINATKASYDLTLGKQRAATLMQSLQQELAPRSKGLPSSFRRDIVEIFTMPNKIAALHKLLHYLRVVCIHPMLRDLMHAFTPESKWYGNPVIEIPKAHYIDHPIEYRQNELKSLEVIGSQMKQATKARTDAEAAGKLSGVMRNEYLAIKGRLNVQANFPALIRDGADPNLFLTGTCNKLDAWKHPEKWATDVSSEQLFRRSPKARGLVKNIMDYHNLNDDGHYRRLVKNYAAIETAKVNGTKPPKEVLGEVHLAPTIIAVWWTVNLIPLIKALEWYFSTSKPHMKVKIKMLNSKLSRDERGKIIRRFTADPRELDILAKRGEDIDDLVVDILLISGNLQAEGLNLQASNRTLFFETIPDLTKYTQVCGRTHRPGQLYEQQFVQIHVPKLMTDYIAKQHRDNNLHLAEITMEDIAAYTKATGVSAD